MGKTKDVNVAQGSNFNPAALPFVASLGFSGPRWADKDVEKPQGLNGEPSATVAAHVMMLVWRRVRLFNPAAFRVRIATLRFFHFFFAPSAALLRRD
jgi:hypothetical protein